MFSWCIYHTFCFQTIAVDFRTSVQIAEDEDTWRHQKLHTAWLRFPANQLNVSTTRSVCVSEKRAQNGLQHCLLNINEYHGLDMCSPCWMQKPIYSKLNLLSVPEDTMDMPGLSDVICIIHISFIYHAVSCCIMLYLLFSSILFASKDHGFMAPWSLGRPAVAEGLSWNMSWNAVIICPSRQP